MLFIFLVFSSLLNIYSETTNTVPKENPKISIQKVEEAKKKAMLMLNQKLKNLDINKMYLGYKTEPIINPNLSYVADRLYGKKTAKNTLVIFSDFACGHCKIVSKDLMSRVDENKDDVNLKYVFFPLDNTCNKNLAGKLSDYSCPAFKLALCSEKVGKLKEAILYLYEKNPLNVKGKIFDQKSFISSMEKDLKVSGMQECLNSDWLKKKVEQENLIYKGLTIPGTPIVLLNGRKLNPIYKSKVLFKEFIRKVNLEKDSNRN